jgi:uncharacterized membrane protein YhhN
MSTFVVLTTLTALSALADWWSRLRHLPKVEQISKPLTTLLVIAIAATSGAPNDRLVPSLIALSLCLVGDVALMSIVDKFVVGLAAFLLGHLAFVVAFANAGLTSATFAGLAIVLCALLVAGIGLAIVRGAAMHDTALRRPVLAYLAIISVMAVFAWATANAWIMVGATLFVVSDTVLGWRQFVRERRWMPVTVMMTYHGAITCLALSLR